MTNIDLNKEGLFSLVKRITEENTSLSNKIPLKTSHYNQKMLLPKLITKKIKYSPRIETENNTANNYSKKTTIFKNKFLEKNNIQINEQNVLHLLSERRKKKLAQSKYQKNTVSINLEENNKKIKNSNSEHFDNKTLNKSIGKDLIFLRKNQNLNMDSLIKNSKSFFKMLNNNNTETNNKSNINNNININININGDINTNKKLKNLFKPNKRFITYENIDEINTDKKSKNLTYQNIKNNTQINPDKIKKKNHKTFYLNNITKFGDNDYSEKKEKNIEHNNTVNINLNIISNPNNKRLLTHGNISNINKINNISNISHLNIERKRNMIIPKEQNMRNSSNINHIKSTRYKNLFNSKKEKEKNMIIHEIKKSNTQTIYELNNEEKEKYIKNKKDIIQLEDLLILEGKFCHLIDCLNYENPLPKMCIEWWNFYTYSSYFGKFPKLFPKIAVNKNEISDYQIAHDSIMFELLSIILTYEILTENELRKSLINDLMKLINEIHQNFLIECDYILSKISDISMTNLWIKKLKNLILSKKNWYIHNINDKSINTHLNLLHERNINIHNIIQYIINICSNISLNNNIHINISLDTLSYFNNNIPNLPLMELSDYFSSEISKQNLKINKAFYHIIKSSNINKKYDMKNNLIIIPYLAIKSNQDKNYTLVLDLDETLISFRIGISGQGILKMRPGLFNFLKKVKSKYELVVFTAGTKEYADPILDIIEKKEKFFMKRLYRQHTIFRDNIYIKDLTKLGRDLSTIIIVDNMPQNFCLQKENGILINNYFGQDNGDKTLYLLGDILMKIAQRPGKDVRDEIKKYKEEIFTKITTNLDN